jgi:DNA-directed RNA polymerase specialized sigma24 family protein
VAAVFSLREQAQAPDSPIRVIPRFPQPQPPLTYDCPMGRSKIRPTLLREQPPAPTNEVDLLIQCANAQDLLTRAEHAATDAQEHRRATVKMAYSHGVPAPEIALALQISKTKVYRILNQRSARGD